MRQSETPESGDPGRKHHHISFAGRRIRMPRSRGARIAIGSILIVLGFFGFLPILGFWMVPLGLFVLSYDVPAIRRFRRRLEVWWHRRRREKSSSSSAHR
ncbi:hypothetical protein [Chelativorans sp. J32]|uniref:hypothetical protein n=1 Tax=Chelativorans sp. J32 TaxID=935840 RepID=UPI000A03E50C|nr:hypothetical protein [Chelativorans sp. J32]